MLYNMIQLFHFSLTYDWKEQTDKFNIIEMAVFN